MSDVGEIRSDIKELIYKTIQVERRTETIDMVTFGGFGGRMAGPTEIRGRIEISQDPLGEYEPIDDLRLLFEDFMRGGPNPIGSFDAGRLKGIRILSVDKHFSPETYTVKLAAYVSIDYIEAPESDDDLMWCERPEFHNMLTRKKKRRKEPKTEKHFDEEMFEI